MCFLVYICIQINYICCSIVDVYSSRYTRKYLWVVAQSPDTVDSFRFVAYQFLLLVLFTAKNVYTLFWIIYVEKICSLQFSH